jgi:hypothetical protein
MHCILHGYFSTFRLPLMPALAVAFFCFFSSSSFSQVRQVGESVLSSWFGALPTIGLVSLYSLCSCTKLHRNHALHQHPPPRFPHLCYRPPYPLPPPLHPPRPRPRLPPPPLLLFPLHLLPRHPPKSTPNWMRRSDSCKIACTRYRLIVVDCELI